MSWFDWIVVLIFILCTLVLIHLCTKSERRKTPPTESKILISTIKDKSTIPAHIFENRRRFAKNYEHVVYDDEECVRFLERHYDASVSNKFKEIRSGAHKADLFRYAYLYKFGGLYVDIKTLFVKDIDEIFTDPTLCYLIVTKTAGLIYNGIIHTPPNNPVMYEMLLRSMEVQPFHEHYFNIKHGTQIIQSKLREPLKQGLNNTVAGVPNFMILFEEFFDKSFCNNQVDRYGFCTFVIDEHERPIIKIRDASYTPNYS